MKIDNEEVIRGFWRLRLKAETPEEGKTLGHYCRFKPTETYTLGGGGVIEITLIFVTEDEGWRLVKALKIGGIDE